MSNLLKRKNVLNVKKYLRQMDQNIDLIVLDKTERTAKDAEKYLTLKPVNQITISPLIAISTAVPRSGWATTKKTGIKKLRKGIKICFILLTFCIGILL